MEKIILTKDEERVLKMQLDGRINEFTPEADKDILMNLIDKAEALMNELDAYDETDYDMMQWYYNKYKAQQSQEIASK